MESIGMLPIELVVALVIALTEAIKRLLKKRLNVVDLDPLVTPTVAIVMGALLNMLNALLFAPIMTGDVIRDAARAGLLAAAAAAGVWSAGANYLQRNKSPAIKS